MIIKEKYSILREIEFREWLVKNQINNKVISDIISRVKRIEREFNVDLDNEYIQNHCDKLLSSFKNHGKNEVMNEHQTSLPIGKAQLAAIKHAVKKYFLFIEESTS